MGPPHAVKLQLLVDCATGPISTSAVAAVASISTTLEQSQSKVTEFIKCFEQLLLCSVYSVWQVQISRDQ